MPKVINSTFDGLIEVSVESPKSHKIAVEKIAHYFKREFRFDFLQYSSDEVDDVISFLFIDIDYKDQTNQNKWRLQTIGAVCFRLKFPSEFNQKIWVLDWIWLHPYDRNKGILSKYWDKFIYRFGPFWISHPLSKSMSSYISKINYPITFESFKKMYFQN
ncbi:MAG: hypothetical protein K2Q22_08065 [Cytophagales bacterium]|nr:hypothetical protein [Cytophagales bacterium]